MAIIVTGGTGKTGIRVGKLLQEANIPFVLTSRNAQASATVGMPVTRFEWGDSSTFVNPFQHISEKVSAIYLIGPRSVTDASGAVNAFVDYAVKEHGVRRFVLTGGTLLKKGGHLEIGKVWTHLDEIGVDYCVLRLTWFMGAPGCQLPPNSFHLGVGSKNWQRIENFSESFKLAPIKAENKIYTATGDGLVPFVSASDIAAVAFHLLTDEKPPAEIDYRVVGPEELTHDQVAAKLSKCLEREMVHVKLSEEESAAQYMKGGMPEGFSKHTANIEVQTKHGLEAGLYDTVEKVTSRPGLTFDEWALENKEYWN